MPDDILFLNNSTEWNNIDELLAKYRIYLQLIGSLSPLFSDSNIPYLYYRGAENIFCKAFGADNLSRSDISIDAKKGDIGIGLKTFHKKNGYCLEKVAEFNRLSEKFRPLMADSKKLVCEISRLRNDRLNVTARIAETPVEKMVYHCVSRSEGEFHISEFRMHLINIDNITGISSKEGSTTISFSDGINEYSFNKSKSTLFMRFDVTNPIYSFPVRVLKDPLRALESMMQSSPEISPIVEPENETALKSIILPLYSERSGIHVPKSSGLNQWNASGRSRDPNEVYIPIPKYIHREYPSFFPSREIPFSLHTPNGHILNAKVCQDGGKALMTAPNKDLGQWILRDVLNLREKELLTYKMLEGIGIDCVEITKNNDLDYSINFKKLGSYEEFKKVSETLE